MSIFPKVQSPCPYKGNLSDIMDGSLCRLCKREVQDLTDMTDSQRVALVAGCKDEICVSYRVNPRSVLAAMAMGAVAVAATPAAACSDCSGKASQASAEETSDEAEYVIIVGGLRKPAQAKWVKDEQLSALPALPVVYEDEKPATQKAEQSQTKSG